jgi:hypothetical protein
MPSLLYLVNLPHNCTDTELKDWVESRGFKTRSIRIIRDVIAGVSTGRLSESDCIGVASSFFSFSCQQRRTSTCDNQSAQGRRHNKVTIIWNKEKA